MKKIYKGGNDFVFAIQIITSDEDGKPQLTRIRKFREIEFKIYTNDIDEYVLASFNSAGTGTLINIVEQEDYDFIVLSKEDIATLEPGIMKIQVDYLLGSGYFKSRTYTETFNYETEYYLFDKLYDSSECTGCCLVKD